MFIAFEGPDNVGKSTAAQELDAASQPDYNVTKAMHAERVAEQEPGTDMPHTYDRIDWFSHMVYRLAMPEKDWNDDRPRTVFAMPETHLVVILHRPDLADFTVPADDESVASAIRTRGVETPVQIVNSSYFYFADFFTGLNEERDYALFKTITILEVANTSEGYHRTLGSFSSPVTSHEEAVGRFGSEEDNVTNDMLLELLHYEDQQRL